MRRFAAVGVIVAALGLPGAAFPSPYPLDLKAAIEKAFAPKQVAISDVCTTSLQINEGFAPTEYAVARVSYRGGGVNVALLFVDTAGWKLVWTSPHPASKYVYEAINKCWVQQRPIAQRAAPVAIATTPFSVGPTRACLLRLQVHLVPAQPLIRYPEVLAELDWRYRSETDITIDFAADSQKAARLAQRYRQVASAFGALPEEIPKLIVQRSNVVISGGIQVIGVLSRLQGIVTRCLS